MLEINCCLSVKGHYQLYTQPVMRYIEYCLLQMVCSMIYQYDALCFHRTWAGPSWSPAQTLSSVLISIQSLMNEKPYHNEPGFEHVRL